SKIGPTAHGIKVYALQLLCNRRSTLASALQRAWQTCQQMFLARGDIGRLAILVVLVHDSSHQDSLPAHKIDLVALLLKPASACAVDKTWCRGNFYALHWR